VITFLKGESLNGKSIDPAYGREISTSGRNSFVLSQLPTLCLVSRGRLKLAAELHGSLSGFKGLISEEEGLSRRLIGIAIIIISCGEYI
jgi:hypothetical protein